MIRTYQVITLLMSIVIAFLIWRNYEINKDNIHLNSAIKSNNEVFGALYDKRKIKDIVEDMYHKDPVVDKVTDWVKEGPEKVDLKGWDDLTIPESIIISRDHFSDFLEEIQAKFAGTGNVKFRIKDISSLVDKFQQKNRSGKFYSLDNIQDIYGFRLVFTEMSDVQKAKEYLEKNFNVIDQEDYYNEPKDSGYRSIHLIINYKGVIIEGQIRTIGMEIWSEWVHDFLYKGKKMVIKQVGQKKFNEFTDYAKNVAAYINAIESCKPATKPIKPEGLEILWKMSNPEQRKYLLPSGEPNLYNLKLINCSS